MKRLIRLCSILFVALTVCLTACTTPKITYETVGGAMCDIKGYDAEAMSYIIASESLYFASPYFLGDFFDGITTEGSAELDGDTVSIGFTRHDDPESGAVHGASISFKVDVEKETVAEIQSTPFEGSAIELSEESMIEMGTKLAEVIRDVEAHLAKEQ